VFGGSFNPVHQGHLELIEAVLRSGAVEHLFAVPANRSPFKGEQELLPAALRWEMLRAALRGLPRVSVLDLELRRPPPSYTIDTVEALASLLPRARLSLVLGADAFVGFAGWYRAGRILARADLLVFGREDGEGPLPADPERWIAALPEPWRGAARPATDGTLQDGAGRLLVRRMSGPIPPISSTRIREGGRLEEVPPGAREVLQGYLTAHPR
jgi:nicotinate-nucleotide adenylyltransferase